MEYQIQSVALLIVMGTSILCSSSAIAQSTQPAEQRFEFGMVRLSQKDVYSPGHAGFDLGSKVHPYADVPGVAGDGGRPFFFSVPEPPGVYQVKIEILALDNSPPTYIKAETRRLMVDGAQLRRPGGRVFEFLVHIRVPTLPDGSTVRLKPRERDPILNLQWDADTSVKFHELDWDEKLTLEFMGGGALSRITVTPAPEHTTVYLIGDSTMTDQMMEPYGAWGQMLPRWFSQSSGFLDFHDLEPNPVVIANYAESGETAASFVGERRWAKLLTEIHAGDYVFMQFGINDMNGKVPLDRFKQSFEKFIADTKAHGATPVLVTSQNLGKLDATGKGIETLGDYPQAMRDVATAQKVTLIDLNQMSQTLYEAIGPRDLPRMFVDGTHQNDYGAYELAKCVVQGIIDAKLPIAEHVTKDWKGFDPAHPDPMDSFPMPRDPQLDLAVKPKTQPTTR